MRLERQQGTRPDWERPHLKPSAVHSLLYSYSIPYSVLKQYMYIYLFNYVYIYVFILCPLSLYNLLYTVLHYGLLLYCT